MTTEKVILSFEGVSTADGNVYAHSLAEDLKDIDRDIQVNVQKDQSETQDFGATIVLIAGTAAATHIANGISRWIARHSGTKVLLKKGSTQLLIENADSASAAKIADALKSAL
jgi:hypothetical protein